MRVELLSTLTLIEQRAARVALINQLGMPRSRADRERRDKLLGELYAINHELDRREPRQ